MPQPMAAYELRSFDECSSTQDLAWASDPPLAPGGVFFVARCQTQGRGRAPGRSWVSPPGGLYLSWRLPLPATASLPASPPAAPPASSSGLDPAGFSLLGGLAVARAILHFGAEPWLKWPNDCWIGAAKVAGVLSDCRWQGNQCQGLVMGIGVNVEVAAEQLPEFATSLHLHTSPAPSLEAFRDRLLEELLKLLGVHRLHGLRGYLPQVRQLSMPAHTPVRYWLGETCHCDRVLGLDEQGFLQLESGQTLAAVDRLERIFEEPTP